MSLELQDLLIEKPVSLILWDLKSDPEKLIEVLQRETEIRRIQTLEEALSWLHSVEVKNLLVAKAEKEAFQEVKEGLRGLTVEKRRELFVVYVSPQLKTLDTKESFLLSANLVLNERDLSEFEKVYAKARAFWQGLYRHYFQAYQKILEERV